MQVYTYQCTSLLLHDQIVENIDGLGCSCSCDFWNHNSWPPQNLGHDCNSSDRQLALVYCQPRSRNVGRSGARLGREGRKEGQREEKRERLGNLTHAEGLLACINSTIYTSYLVAYLSIHQPTHPSIHSFVSYYLSTYLVKRNTRISKLSAHHSCIIIVPGVVTDGTPVSIDVHLHSTLTRPWAIP